MSGSGRWSDLALRVATGLVMACVGLGAVWAGGWVFITFVAILSGLIAWELAAMLAPGQRGFALQTGAATGLAGYCAIWGPAAAVVPTLLVPVVVGWFALPEQRRIFIPFLLLILVASFGMSSVRDSFGMMWMAWLICVVAATDIAGYFAGRLIGGPKLWPRVSPKKTWSGTSAGWIAAAFVGLAFMGVLGAGAWLAVLSVATSVASQAGDLAQSAVKRRAGVKDSSNLLPGHGGVFDRFDGMIAASALVLAVMQTTGYPPGP
ncbi:phosphatidate cytidylyltransferase [Marinibacterium profundimaris]|uniref:Phosphatidate cytidylyltransferase n=1 Tax=Marinibacterium profundimaris TaxID=1679460 RepID=A0A225NR97_9RHOB|nr:phosphatidate cytidylyltransferase [Marinibacterium profundimaris]OWU77471.1 phosphatidate cytidylyltransferase [Marinibacterium profundimaris]